MQLTLATTFAPRSGAASPVPPRGTAATSREAVALSQLDRIAAQNLRAPAHGLGSAGMLLALLGGLVVLGSASMWSGAAGDEPREPRTTVLAQSRPATTAVTPATTATPAATAVVSQAMAPAVVGAAQSTPHALATPEPATAIVAAVEAAPDDAARKARAKQLADARRKAALQAQERALADETQRLQLAQQREVERAQQQQHQLAEQSRQRAAAEQARSQPVQLALDTRRSVSESCSAAGSLISRQFCRARECGKSEHRGDPICMHLREDELAQQRASNNR